MRIEGQDAVQDAVQDIRTQSMTSGHKFYTMPRRAGGCKLSGKAGMLVEWLHIPMLWNGRYAASDR